jgi:hypothetical protein
MEATKSTTNNSYSLDQIIKTAFEMELQTLKLHDEVTNKDMVASYLKSRIDEIKERWK